MLCHLEVATDRTDRRRGLLGRDGIEGGLLIERARSVHTLGMRFPIDVAHLDADGVVVRTTTMARNRIGRPVLRAACILEAEAGCFRHWELTRGQVLEIDHRTGEQAVT